MLLAQVTPLNLNEQPIIVKDEGVRQGTARATVINCSGAGVTCTQSGTTMTLTIPGGGGSGGGAPVDGGFVTFSGGTTGSTNERTLTAGTNVTISTATPGQVIISASGGSGSANFAADTATFAGKSDALKTVTAAWASGASSIICTADGEEASVEGAQFVVTSKAAGSFVVRSYVLQGTHTGALPFTCTGN